MRALLAIAVVAISIWCGQRWEAVNTATHDVTVTLKDGRRETGTLTHTWNREFVLTKPDGWSIRFPNYSMLEFTAQPASGQPVYSQHWRLFLSLGIGLSMACLLWLWAMVRSV